MMKLDFLEPAISARDMRSLPWPEDLRILVMAPHPDDFDAVAETLLFLQGKGADLHVAVAMTGSGIDPDFAPGATVEDKRQLRKHEQMASARYFGLADEQLAFLNLVNAADEQLDECPENRAIIEAVVNSIRPHLIFCPHGNDTNRAHRAMHALVSSIAADASWPLALMLNRDAKTIEMATDLYIGFDEEMAAWKGSLLRCHASQQHRNLRTRGIGFDGRVLQLNKAIAAELQIEMPYAAAYEVVLYT